MGEIDFLIRMRESPWIPREMTREVFYVCIYNCQTVLTIYFRRSRKLGYIHRRSIRRSDNKFV